MKKNFTTSSFPSGDLCALLSRTVLGTNGAKYQHLDTEERLREMDNPLYLSLIRKNKTIANVTFCKREEDWYVRYFAFDSRFQSSGKENKKKKNSSLLKLELKQFFQDNLQNGSAKQFYAYVDSENVRSKQMTEVFGFKRIAQIQTTTFSRIRPKSKLQITSITNKKEINDLVAPAFKSNAYYTNHHVLNSTGTFYVAKKEGRIVAFAKLYKANWKIHALPGKFGKKLVKIVPYIPIIRKIITPNKFSFLVPEAVWVANHNPMVLSDFFESVLKKEDKKTIMWWNETNNRLLNNVKESVKWGLLSKISKPKKVDLVSLSNAEDAINEAREIYTVGIDFI
ncbi:MAG: hypothetical protein ACPGU5_00575 [Lishizhenia sp.]